MQRLRGSGIDLLMAYHGWSFAEAAKQVDAIIGREPTASYAKVEDPEIAARRQALNKLWRSGRPITPDDPAGKYLNRRCGLTTFPPVLR